MKREVSPWLIALFVSALTVLAYAKVGACGFVNLDDDAYVEHQPLVNQGFRAPALVWAFTGSHSSNWHPLTTLSHILDCQLFGLRAAPMHWENVLLHAINSVLVFLAWRKLTGAVWRPAALALFFALHPLHVESVAWISERKDLLCALFWLLGLLAYVRYVQRPSGVRYGWVVAALVAALLAKPMAVTLPCTLLLLDYWPLRRWPEVSWGRLLREKLPLFGLVIIHSFLTYVVQSGSGAALYGQRFDLGERIGNALVAYARYVGKMFWPDTLAPLYHHPGTWPIAAIAAAAGLLLIVSAFAWWKRAAHPSFLIGWLWFVGTLVPVIGLVQVGAQSMADRYMYIPMLGILTALLWQIPAWSTRSSHWQRSVVAMILVTLAACGYRTFRQVSAWTDSVTLYERSIAAGEDNASVRYLLGTAYAAANRPVADVAAQFQTALRLQPDYTNAFTQLAVMALANQRLDEARALLEEATRRDPRNPGTHNNLGAFFIRLGQPEQALTHFRTALQLDPNYISTHRELARLHASQNRLQDARAHFAALVKREPWNPEYLNEYGANLANLGLHEEARTHLQRALWIRPDFPLARANLDVVEKLRGGK